MCIFLVSSGLLTLGCNKKTEKEPHPADEVDLSGILTSLGENVIVPIYTDFHTAAVALETAASAYYDALGDGTDAAAALTTLEEGWKTTMAAWQQAEMLQIGPAGSSADAVAGANLRDEIYSWPTVNNCRVDQELVAGEYSEANFFSVNLVNTYGLDVVEYLVFNQSADNSCPSYATMNTDGSWEGLTEANKALARANYVKALAANLLTRAQELVDHWAASKGNFVADLSKAGSSDSVYESQLQALNDVFAAMFYLDTTVKDKKLALPAGIDVGCESACPDKLESQWAQVSKEHIVANLQAFQRTFHGGLDATAHTGFDDFLVDMGYADLATTMTNDIASAITTTQALDGTMHSALSSNLDGVKGVHAAVKAVTDNLKADFVTILNLTIPSEGAGDSD